MQNGKNIGYLAITENANDVKAAIDDEFLNNSGGYYNNDIGSFSSPHQLANDQLYCEKLMAEIYLITKEHIK